MSTARNTSPIHFFLPLLFFLLFYRVKIQTQSLPHLPCSKSTQVQSVHLMSGFSLPSLGFSFGFIYPLKSFSLYYIRHDVYLIVKILIMKNIIGYFIPPPLVSIIRK